jgi:tetratricopeptide (TPR) repeat protein
MRRQTSALGLLPFLFFFLLSLPAWAQANRSLDELFVALREAPDTSTASAITDEIWERWTTPDDPDLAAQMETLLEKRSRTDLRTALEIANEMVTAFPDYAEGWNQRATLFFLLGNYQASLDDIAETLEREPRHFGALAGKVLILLELGDETEARKTLVDALAINPFLSERRLFPDLGPPPIRT